MIWMWVSAALAGNVCGADDLKKGVEALSDIEPDHQVMLATAALAIACKFPAPVKDVVSQFQSVPPEYLPMMDAKLATVAIGDWMAACPGGSEKEWVASSGLTVAPILLGEWLTANGGADKTSAKVYARALAGISDRAQDNPVKEFKPLIPK